MGTGLRIRHRLIRRLLDFWLGNKEYLNISGINHDIDQDEVLGLGINECLTKKKIYMHNCSLHFTWTFEEVFIS